MPSNRELFLQNSLARAAVLLFRCTRYLTQQSNRGEAQLLLTECEIFFSETKASLAAELRATARGESPTFAKSVEKSGENLAWVGPPGWQRTNPVSSTVTEMKSGEPISATSSGGITQTETPCKPSLPTPVPNSFAMRLKSVLIGSRNSGGKNDLPLP